MRVWEAWHLRLIDGLRILLLICGSVWRGLGERGEEIGWSG